MDAGIGDLFNCRIAGNIQNDDILGSLEFACQLAGSKIVMVMGHTRCGAVKGAIANAKLGMLTSLLDKIKSAIEQTQYSGEKSPDNYQYVDAVAKTNVMITINEIRKKSFVLRQLEEDKKIKIVGCMYHLTGGKIEFL